MSGFSLSLLCFGLAAPEDVFPFQQTGKGSDGFAPHQERGSALEKMGSLSLCGSISGFPIGNELLLWECKNPNSPGSTPPKKRKLKFGIPLLACN